MHLDPRTLLITMLLAILAISGSYFLIWLQDRRQTALVWLGAATLLAAAAFAVRVLLLEVPAVVISNPMMLAVAACIWMACRDLGGRRALPWALAIPGIVWLCLCTLPVFMARSELRVAVANLLIAPLFVMAALEIWRLDTVSRLARWWVFGILALQGLGCFAQALSHGFWPGPNRMSLESFEGFALMALSAQGFVILVSFGMIALVKEQSAERDRHAAAIDALTGLANRRRLDAVLANAAAGAVRSDRPLALIMIDVDSFKEYNDIYGHLQGDACLKAIADALREGGVRKHDLVARYGGEEFVVLLPDADAEAAERIADRLRLAVRALGLKHAGRPGGIVTISLGVAVLEPGRAITGAGGLLNAADQALYRAKQMGRDCVVGEARKPAVPRLRLVSETSSGEDRQPS